MGTQIFHEEHEIFRRSLRSSWRKKPSQSGRVAPQPPDTQEIWKKMGNRIHRLTGWKKGTGVGADFVYSVVSHRRNPALRGLGLGTAIGVHNDITMPYIEMLGTEEQKLRCSRNAVGGNSSRRSG